MNQKLDGSPVKDWEIESQIGKQIDFLDKIKFGTYGSNLYNLKKITTHLGNSIQQPTENSRCNFEKYENGILLRINDKQRMFCLPLSIGSTIELIMKKGKESILFLSLSHLLLLLGVKIETLKRYYFLSKGILNERYQFIIKTKSETILLDANPSNFTAEKKFFQESVLGKIFVVEE